MKFKKFINIFICVTFALILFSCTANQSKNIKADESKTSDDNREISDEKIINVFKTLGYDISKEEFDKNYKKNIKSGKLEVLRDMGGSLLFDNKGELIHADFLDLLEFSDNEIDKNYPSETFVESIKENFIDKNYTEELKSDFTKDYIAYSFYEKNPAGVFNPYDQIRVVFDNVKDRVILYSKFNDYKIEKEPSISEDEASKIALDFLDNKASKVDKITLTVVASNEFFDENKQEKKDSKDLHLAYVVEIADDMVYVDAYDGKIIGGDSY